MGDNAKRIHYTAAGAHGTGDGDRERVTEWEEGLPSIDDLMPLSQALISAELMSAFIIPPEPYRTSVEVNQASQDTLSSLQGNSVVFSSNNFESYKDGKNRDLLIIEEDDEINADLDDFVSRKVRRINSPEETDSAMRTENSTDDQSNRTLKRPRLVWTPQLHKRFVEVVAILGVAQAVPKTTMQMMNVEGLTRENVASHLQKYRLYLKRMQGLSNEDPSSSDPVFGSVPVPQSSHETSVGSGHGHVQMPIPPVIPPMIPPMPMPYPPHMMQMPVLGQGHMRMPYGNPNIGNYHGFESHPYNNMMQLRDWSGNSFGSYPPVAPNQN